jgi:hypothetical protein
VAILQQSLTGPAEHGTLELDDIQHFLMSRPPARAARYEFLTFQSPASGRAWLMGLIDKVGTAKAVGSNMADSRWVTIGFTSNGLKAIGVDEASLATFPGEFRQGMAARAEILGTTGANHPDHWVGGLASPDLHAIAILFARDVTERERCRNEHKHYLARCGGVELLSFLDLEALPPFDYAHEHFGYRDRLSRRLSKERERSRRPALARRSNQVNSFSDTRMKTVPQRECLSRRFFLVTAAMSRI